MSEITNGMSGLEAREILNSVTTRPYTDWGLNTDIILGGEFEAPLVEALLITNLAEFDYDPLDNVSKFKATRPYSINFPIALPITSWYDDACVYIAKDAFKDNTVLLEAEFTYARIIGESSFEGSALTSISMPLLTEVPANAFKLCADLATVSFDGVTSLANNDAFYNCGITGITDINFSSLTTIVGNPFQYSSFLTEINSTSITTCDNFKHLSGLTSVTLPNLTTLNGPQAFKSCSNLTTIDIAIPVPLNGEAFRGCVDLVTLPDLDSAIITGRYNFEQCTSLTTINMDNCTQVLNPDYEDQTSYNFASCTSLTEIHFPLLTLFEGDYNFAGCSSLAEISMDIITDLPGQSNFDGCSALTTIYMPQLSTTGFGFYNTFEGVGDNGTITVNADISSDTNWVNVIEPYLDGKGWTITYYTPWNPSQLTGLWDWWTASDGVNLTGVSVDSWTGYNSNVLSPFNAGTKAEYIASDPNFNNEPSVLFNPNYINGGDYGYYIPVNSNTTSKCIFMVAKLITKITTDTTDILAYNSLMPTRFATFSQPANPLIDIYDSVGGYVTPAGSSYVNGDYVFIRQQYNITNGVLTYYSSTSNSFTNSIGTLNSTPGLAYTGGNFNVNGYSGQYGGTSKSSVVEVIVMDALPTLGEVTELENYIQTKYNI